MALCSIPFGLEVMIRIATTVDDTVLLNKSMLTEWVQETAAFSPS